MATTRTDDEEVSVSAERGDVGGEDPAEELTRTRKLFGLSVRTVGLRLGGRALPLIADDADANDDAPTADPSGPSVGARSRRRDAAGGCFGALPPASTKDAVPSVVVVVEGGGGGARGRGGALGSLERSKGGIAYDAVDCANFGGIAVEALCRGGEEADTARVERGDDDDDDGNDDEGAVVVATVLPCCSVFVFVVVAKAVEVACFSTRRNRDRPPASSALDISARSIPSL